MQYLVAISKNDGMILICFQGKPFNITVIQVYAPIANVKEAEGEWFYKDLQHLLKLTTPPPKKIPFLSWGLECKSRKSRETWTTDKFGLGVQNEAG